MKRKDIFNIRKVKDGENDTYIICLGDNLASRKKFKTEKEAEEYIVRKPWELIATTCAIIGLSSKEFKNQ